MRTLLSWLSLGTLALAGLPAPAGAQPVGSEFQVIAASQGSPSVGANASGQFVVAWTGNTPGGYRYVYSIFGQRYDSQGQALGANFQVTFDKRKLHEAPDVIVNPVGHFVVVWDSFSLAGVSGIYGQRYDSSGAELGGEFQVHSAPGGKEWPSLASDAAGNFVVAWGSGGDGSGYGVFGQLFNRVGEAVGSEFQVNSFTTGDQQRPSVAFSGANQFVVVWESVGQDGDGYGIFGQRFDSAGNALRAEFPMNSYTTSRQSHPAVAADASGNFVVVWRSDGQDGSSSGVFGQRFDTAGEVLGSEFQVNSYTTSPQQYPSVASDAAGNFLVAWQSSNQDGDSSGIFGQRYDTAGVAQGDEFQVNTYTTSAQDHPSVAAAGTNEFVVVWESWLDAIVGQRYDFGGGASTLHVGDLDRRARNVAANWRAQVKALVHDDGHSPLSGALVTLDVSGVGTRTCTTTAAGQCEIIVVVSDSVPSLTFTVTNLSKAGFSYDAGANHDPDPDSNGTFIVVNQP